MNHLWWWVSKAQKPWVYLAPKPEIDSRIIALANLDYHQKMGQRITCQKAPATHWRSWRSMQQRGRRRQGWPGSSCWCPSASCRGKRWRSPAGLRRSPPGWSLGRQQFCTCRTHWSEGGPCGPSGCWSGWWWGPWHGGRWGSQSPTLIQAHPSSHITLAPNRATADTWVRTL